MDSNTAQYLIGGIVGLLVLYLVIRAAISHGTTYAGKLAWMQVNLLVNIARKLGVTEEEINASLDDKR